MIPKTNNSTNGNKFKLVRWIVGGLFSLFMLVNGFHYSSLFLLCAAFLMFPIPFVETYLKSKNIKTILVIVLSCVLFFVGAVTAPSSQASDTSIDYSTETTQEDSQNNMDEATTDSGTTIEESTTILDDTTSNENETTNQGVVTIEADTTPITEKQVEKVWVSSSGKKYHSSSTCSNMSSPRQISIDDAIRQNYEACKKCYK